MARNHLRFSVDAWRDPDWLALSRDAQWLFVTILSQPRMTLVGSLDVNVMRWASLAADGTPADIEAALDELERQRFVILDRHTGELLVRSFTKNDLAPGRISQQIAKGFWSAWKGIASPELRRLVVDNCPPEVWEKVERHAPDDVVQNRRSSPIDWEPPPPSEREVESPIDNPPTRSLPPDACFQQPAADAAAADLTPEDLCQAAIDVLVDRTMEVRRPTTNPDGYRHALLKGKRADHEAKALELIDAWGVDIGPVTLAEWLEPHLFPKAAPAKPLRLACGTCNDTTWLDAPVNDDGTWGPPRPCPDCNQAATA